MKNPKFTAAELAIIYKIVSKIIDNTSLDPVAGKTSPGEFHSFKITPDDIEILNHINNLLSSLF